LHFRAFPSFLLTGLSSLFLSLLSSTPMMYKEPKTGYNIHNAAPIEKIFIFVHLVLISIWECLVAVVSNLAPLGWCRYKDISGQNILITGSANGLGRLMALQLAKHDEVTLLLWDRDEVGLKKVKEECESIGAKVQTFIVDMTKSGEIKKAAQRIMKEVRRIDILINNAGIGIGGKILEISEENVRKTFEVNTLSHFWMIKEFLPDMYDRNLGHIVSIASLGGITVSPQDLITYCSSKFASLAFMEGLENEATCLGKTGVRFTTVCPGYFQSPLLNNLTSKTNMPVMTPEYVAESAVDAILRELRIAMVPRTLYAAYIFKGLVPRTVSSRILTTLFRNSR
ncbi:hypothetical protein PFISCL1PPCAC_2623, partial [Pristionchus fissidentatus]